MAWLQTRAFIGAKYEPDTNSYHYPWTDHNINEQMPLIIDAACAITTTVTSGATSVTFHVSGAGIVPPRGGVWIAGNGTGEAWEYIQYSSVTDNGGSSYTLNNCQREPTINREHNGVHTSGAEVRFFWKLDTMEGEFSFVEELDDEECIIDWTAEVTGWKFPQAALRDGHLLIYQTRTSPSAEFTNALIGFIDERNSEHDYQRHDKWVVKIVSCSGMINRYRARGVRRGKFNLATGANVQGTAGVKAAWKERNSGDFVEAEPNLDVSSAVDGEKKTLYISEQMIGTEPDHYQHSRLDTPSGEKLSLDDPSIRTSDDAYGRATMMAGAMIISEIHIQRAVGQPGGYRYIELTALDNLDLGTGTDLYIATDDHTKFLPFVISPVVTGDKIVICENEDKFRSENPSAEPKQLIDISKGAYSTFFSDLSVLGDTLGLFYEFEAVTSHFYHVVTWGAGGDAEITTLNNPSMYTSDITFSPSLAVAALGQTYHYNYARSATAADNWDVGNIQTVGTTLDNKVWMLIELPPIGLMLAEDITSGYTGVVYLTDGTEETTAGLAASGDIIIGDERISYSTRTETTITITTRGVGGSTATAHAKDDPIYVVYNDLAVDCYAIRAVELVRVGSNLISNYTLRYTSSTYAPRTPEDAGYTADYEVSVSVTGNTDAHEIYNLASTHRMRHCLLEFDAMSSEPARPRLNEIRFIPDEAYFPSSSWMATGSESGQMIGRILDNVGFPSAGYTINTTPEGGNHGTANHLAWDVIKEYATYAGLTVEVGRDSKITVGINSYFLGDTFTTVYTWDKSDSTSVKALHAPPKSVSQVKVNWQSTDGETKGVAVYPTIPAATGEELELSEQVYIDADDATERARKLYYRSLYPYSYLTQSHQNGSTFRPGQFHQLTEWQLNKESAPMNRLCLVKSVDHRIQQSQKTHTLAWFGVCNLVEIQREAAA